MSLDVTKFASNIYPDEEKYALIFACDEVWGFFNLDEHGIDEVKDAYERTFGFKLHEETRVIDGVKHTCLIEED